jgi:hypothetical protein
METKLVRSEGNMAVRGVPNQKEVLLGNDLLSYSRAFS